MNEHMKPPRAGTAHNYGRRDNIRAGSVTGPWRSTPSDRASVPSPTDPPAMRADMPAQRSVRTPEAAPGQERHASVQSEQAGRVAPQAQKPFGREAAAADATSGDAPVGERSRSRGRSTLLPAVLGGSLAALAIVGGAVYLRAELSRPEIALEDAAALVPVPDTDIPAPDTPAPRPADPAEGDAAVTENADPAASGPAATAEPGGTTVPPLRLRVGEGFPEEDRLELIAHLEASGHARVLVEEIPFPIALSRVGYYQSEDLAAAEALASEIAPLLGATEGDIAVRDYGNLLPDAQPGRLDLWIKSP